MRLSAKSWTRLTGVHDDLVRVLRRAIHITDLDFMVLEGLRTVGRQKQLVASGASETMRSRHLTGHAVDIGAMVGRQLRWDWPLYDRLSIVMKRAAEDEGVPIEWGGDWKTLKDGPHYQLPWKDYP